MTLNFLKISKFSAVLSIFSVVIVLPSTFFPFIGGKDYFFRTAVGLAIIFLMLWWAYEAKPGEAKRLFQNLIKSPIFWAVTSFVAIFELAVVFAYDFRAAFWSNYERGEGGFQMLHYYAFFFLLALLFQNWDDWKLIIKSYLGTSLLVISYGALGNLGVDGFIGSPGGWAGRFQASLGNADYVGTFLMFGIFFAFYLLITTKNKIKNTPARILIYTLLAIVYLIFFILAGTRGSFVGLAAATLFFLIYIVFSEPRWRLLFIGLLVFIILTGGTAFYYRNTVLVQKLPGSRFLNISLNASGLAPRLWTWGSAFKAFKEKPILGWGPENFSAAFDKYFDIRHYSGPGSETWFDRAHSVILDYLSETGIIGLLAYLSIWLAFYVSFRKSRKRLKKPAEESSFEKGLVLALPLGYLVQGLSLFEVFPLYISWFLFLAFAVYLTSVGKNSFQNVK